MIDHLDEVTMMTDLDTAKILSQRRNIQRYCRLLGTELTDIERQYLHRRIAEEHAQLQRLEKGAALKKRAVGQYTQRD
jgi:5-bromo-4-chloroindolyl phosphate hydrolysis protein